MPLTNENFKIDFIYIHHHKGTSQYLTLTVLKQLQHIQWYSMMVSETFVHKNQNLSTYFHCISTYTDPSEFELWHKYAETDHILFLVCTLVSRNILAASTYC